MEHVIQRETGIRFAKRQLITGFAGLLMLTTVVTLWLLEIHAVRIKELRYRLKSGTDQNTSVRTLSLVSRFQLLLQQRGPAIEAMGNNREARVMQILAETAYSGELDNLNNLQLFIKATIDVFDMISGAPPFKYDHFTREQRLLERAFYHEITRNYSEAILAYETALGSEKKMVPSTKAYTLLHLGFCKALAGERQDAENNFRTVLSLDTDEEYRETARQLLDILSNINRKLAAVDALPISVEKATAYYHLTAYKQAVDTFNKVQGVEQNSEALHYLGRSQEEMGNTSVAVANYRRSIQINPQSAWAVKANRRLFALGSFYAAGKEYRQESTTNVEKGKIQDRDLLKEAARFQEVSERIEIGEKKVVSNLIPIQPPLKTEIARVESPPAMTAKPDMPPSPLAKPAEVRPPQKIPPVAALPPAKTKPQANLPIVSAPTITKPPAAPADVAPPIAITEAAPTSAAASEKPAPTPAPVGPIDWDKLETLPRAEKIAFIQKQQQKEIVTLSNGNQFTGILITEDKDRILLFTSLGKVILDPSMIESRTIAPAKNGLRK